MTEIRPLHRTLEQELFALLRGASLECLVCGEFVLRRGGALLRGASLECLVCGEFVLRRGGALLCNECGSDLRVGGSAESRLQSGLQAG